MWAIPVQFPVLSGWRNASPNTVSAIRARASRGINNRSVIYTFGIFKMAEIVRDAHVCGEIYIAANVIGS